MVSGQVMEIDGHHRDAGSKEPFVFSSSFSPFFSSLSTCYPHLYYGSIMVGLWLMTSVWIWIVACLFGEVTFFGLF